MTEPWLLSLLRTSSCRLVPRVGRREEPYLSRAPSQRPHHRPGAPSQQCVAFVKKPILSQPQHPSSGPPSAPVPALAAGITSTRGVRGRRLGTQSQPPTACLRRGPTQRAVEQEVLALFERENSTD